MKKQKRWKLNHHFGTRFVATRAPLIGSKDVEAAQNKSVRWLNFPFEMMYSRRHHKVIDQNRRKTHKQKLAINSIQIERKHRTNEMIFYSLFRFSLHLAHNFSCFLFLIWILLCGYMHMEKNLKLTDTQNGIKLNYTNLLSAKVIEKQWNAIVICVCVCICELHFKN